MVILQPIEVFGQARFGTFVQVVIQTVVEAVYIVLHTSVSKHNTRVHSCNRAQPTPRRDFGNVCGCRGVLCAFREGNVKVP
jgi:hypothetical protein